MKEPEEALAILENGQIELLLADVNMPGIKPADCTTLPVQNSAEPAMEIDAGKLDAPFSACTASAARPAQPVPPDPFAFAACI